jgi:hypothetical protein
LEEGDHHKYPGRAKVPVEALASLAAGDCSIVAAVEPAVVEPAVVAAAAVDAAVAVAALGLAVAVVVEPAAAAVAEAQELGDFVAGHHCHQTLMWEMEEG